MEEIILFELAVSLLVLVFIRMDSDARGTERKQAIFVLAEIEDEFLGVEGAALGFVDLFCHRNRS